MFANSYGELFCLPLLETAMNHLLSNYIQDANFSEFLVEQRGKGNKQRAKQRATSKNNWATSNKQKASPLLVMWNGQVDLF